MKNQISYEKSIKILLTLVAVFIVFASANSAAAQKMEIPEAVRVWKLGGKDGNITSQNTYSEGKGYNLHCETNSKYLTWEKMPVGINLNWTANSNLKKIHLQLPDGKEREILSGELVGFAVGGSPAFLNYTHRTVGINLEWKKDPVYQWRIFGADTELGKPIPTGSLVAIVNEKVEPATDFMVYVDRPPGIADVGWTTSPEFFNKIGNGGAKLLTEAAKKYFGGK
ncbi:MAG: hypothetical protein M3T96_04525 [Acidobacteriota bacterium]|nr:hypothetical protein [Acidobacteriota bacterium]